MEANRIAYWRKRKRLSQERLATMLNSGRSTIAKLEGGRMELTARWMDRIGLILGVDPAELLPGAQSREVEVIGYIGAGAEVFPLDEQPRGEGLYQVQCPRGLDPAKTVAAEIRGDSMLPIEDGWVVYWVRMHEGVPIDALGHLCVVQVANGGPRLIKHLRKGYSPGRFNLVSSNAAIREDVLLEWASRVRAVLPRELALPAEAPAAPSESDPVPAPRRKARAAKRR